MALHNSCILQKNIKQKFVLERLLKLGVMESQTGQSVYELDYDELKYELVLASFRKIDSENAESKWF